MYMREDFSHDRQPYGEPPENYAGQLFDKSDREEEVADSAPVSASHEKEKRGSGILGFGKGLLDRFSLSGILSSDWFILAAAVFLLCDDKNDDDLLWLLILLCLVK